MPILKQDSEARAPKWQRHRAVLAGCSRVLPLANRSVGVNALAWLRTRTASLSGAELQLIGAPKRKAVAVARPWGEKRLPAEPTRAKVNQVSARPYTSAE